MKSVITYYKDFNLTHTKKYVLHCINLSKFIKHIITIYNILQENASVDNIVKFLIQQNKIGTGYNAIYTVLDNVCTM